MANEKPDIIFRLLARPPVHEVTASDLVEAAQVIETLRRERNEARRWLLQEWCGRGDVDLQEDVAKQKGWEDALTQRAVRKALYEGEG